MHRALVALLVLLVSTAPAMAAASERRVALVIGNGAYQNTRALPNAPNDAKAVAAALRGLGFEVVEALDLTYGTMQAALGTFADQLQNAKVGLFFYAGHGLQVAGENYLIPIDAKLEREAQLGFQAMPVQLVLRAMEAEVPTRLVLLDACRNNPLARTLARSMGATRSAAVGQGLASIQAGVGTLIAYATAPGEVALDGTERNSPFTTALLQHVSTPGLEVRQVLTRVRSSVLDMTDDRQVPWDSSSLRGDFYFVPTLQAPAPDVDDKALELAFWQSAQDPADFEAYLARYPNGVYAALARNRLARPKAQQQAALSPLQSEPPQPTVRSWDKTFGGQALDGASAVAALPDSGFVVAGYTESKGTGRGDAWVLRLDADGQLLWDKTFGGQDREFANAIAALPDGGLAIVGSTRSKGAGESDAWVLRLDADGQLLWDKTFGGQKVDFAKTVAALPDGGLAIVGSTGSKSESDAWVLRLDADGQLLLDKAFGGQDEDSASAVVALPDGSLAIVSYTRSKGAGDGDIWVLRLGTDGQRLWDKTFGGRSLDSASAVAALPDGGLAIAGYTESKGTGSRDVWVLRLDADGQLLWDKTFGGRSPDSASAVAALPDGGLAIVGSTRSKGAGESDVWVLRLDADGQLLWDKTFGGQASDGASAVAALPDGGLAIAGSTRSKGAGDGDAWVLRLTPEGEVAIPSGAALVSGSSSSP